MAETTETKDKVRHSRLMRDNKSYAEHKGRDTSVKSRLLLLRYYI